MDFIFAPFYLKFDIGSISVAVGAGPCACPSEGNHRGLPLQKMPDNGFKP